MNPIFYGRQFINDADIQAVVDVLKGDFLTQGPKVNEFEDAFSDYIGCKHSIAVNNGTSALHLSALAHGVSPGDKWITSPITFAASGNCIRYCGGDVDFVDIDPETLTMDLNQLEEKAKTGKYKGVIPVDFGGNPVHMDEVFSITQKYGMKIIEDACHAPGASFLNSKGEKVNSGNGQYADLAIFSFHPVKHIACGEGGMVTTNSDELASKMRKLRTHGITKNPAEMSKNDGAWYMEMQELGYNFRMPDMLCALGLSQLSRAAENLKVRRKIAANYDIQFSDLPLKLQKVKSGDLHAYHLYVIQTNRRDEMYEWLKKSNIFAQVHYIPLHTMPYYQQFGFKNGDFPHAENYYSKALSIPMYPSLTAAEIDYVVTSIQGFFK